MQRMSIGFILMLFLFSATAQNETDKNSGDEEFKVIKMPKFPIADFPKKSVHVSGITLLQLVRDSVRLGYVKKGIDNHAVQIKLTKDLTAFLQEQLDRMYKNDYKEDGIKILFVLKDLRIGERSAFMEMAYTKFNAEAYISTDGAQYLKATGIDTVFIRESGSDVTAWHGEDIQDAFKVLLKETLSIAKAGTASATAKSLEQITALNRPVMDLPILTASDYAEGAYASFEEFIQNKPSVNFFQPIAIDKKRVKFIQMKENNTADTLQLWGLCKKGELYKYEDGYLLPIEKQGNGFIISNYVKLADRRNANSFGLMFGLMGVLADEAIKSGAERKQKEKLMLVKSIPYIQKENKQPEACAIDMKTGELSF
jgi:hypothetical protein